jgi:hypothetical protein
MHPTITEGSTFMLIALGELDTPKKQTVSLSKSGMLGYNWEGFE